MNINTSNPNRVLAVITYQLADDMCKERIDNWTKHTEPGSVLFSGADKPFWVPSGAHSIKRGKDEYVRGERDLNLCFRLSETISSALHLAKEPDMAELILIEPDVWFWGEPDYNDGFTAKLAGNGPRNTQFWHWPYVISGRGNAQKLERVCKTLIQYNSSCQPYPNFPDRFAGLAVDLSGINKHDGRQITRNSVSEKDVPNLLKNKPGKYAIHGIKKWEGDILKLK